MSDAFRCNGCGEYYDEEFRFLYIDLDTDVVSFADITLDDIPTEAFGILEGKRQKRQRGDLCPECGMAVLEDLVERFQGGESSASE